MTERARTIELFFHERIVGRGNERTAWFVRQADGWTKATEWPGATVESRDTGPGTVWEQAVQLTLPVGTELMRVESRPRPMPPKDPMAYLRSAARQPPRATRRTYYRVDPAGRLVALPKR